MGPTEEAADSCRLEVEEGQKAATMQGLHSSPQQPDTDGVGEPLVNPVQFL